MLVCSFASVVSDCLDPMDNSPPGSSVRFSWQKILEWVDMLSFKRSFGPGVRTCVSCIVDGLFFLPLRHWGSRFLNSVRAKSLQSCPALCNPLDCSPPISSVYGILQVRILKWVTMPSFRGSFRPRDWTHVSYVSCTVGEFFTTEPLRKPFFEQMGKQSKIFIWLITD